MEIRFEARALLVAALAMALAATQAAAYTAKMYAWITPTSECPTSSSNLPAMDDVLEAWHDKMDDKGWPSGGKLVDGAIGLDRFCDIDSGQAGCSDSTNGVDEGDAVMIGVHGTDSTDHWTGLLRWNGTSNASCRANSSDDFRPGDSDAEFIHLLSCHSMDDDNMPETYKMMYDPVDSPVNGRRLHVITGFHGNAWIGTGWKGEYKQVAKDGFTGSVRDAWLDNTYDGNVGSNDEQCPVAYSIGPGATGCENNLLNDGYGTPNNDPSSNAHACYSYFEDCDPDDETPFNPPN